METFYYYPNNTDVKYSTILANCVDEPFSCVDDEITPLFNALNATVYARNETLDDVVYKYVTGPMIPMTPEEGNSPSVFYDWMLEQFLHFGVINVCVEMPQDLSLAIVDNDGFLITDSLPAANATAGYNDDEYRPITASAVGVRLINTTDTEEIYYAVRIYPLTANNGAMWIKSDRICEYPGVFPNKPMGTTIS